MYQSLSSKSFVIILLSESIGVIIVSSQTPHKMIDFRVKLASESFHLFSFFLSFQNTDDLLRTIYLCALIFLPTNNNNHFDIKRKNGMLRGGRRKLNLARRMLSSTG